jgi:hypothetical protein
LGGGGDHILHIARAQDGWTALIGAGCNGHAGCVRLLLDAGADKDIKTNDVRGRSTTSAKE